MKFYTFELTGADTMVAKCKGTNCTINNANAYVTRSKASTTAYTAFKATSFDTSGYMKFKVTLSHDGNINSTICASGKIAY